MRYINHLRTTSLSSSRSRRIDGRITAVREQRIRRYLVARGPRAL